MCVSASRGVGSQSEAWVGHMSAMPNKTKKDKVIIYTLHHKFVFALRHVIFSPCRNRCLRLGIKTKARALVN